MTSLKDVMVLNLPLDEIRNNSVSDLGTGSKLTKITIAGAPQVNYDYFMGSSIAFLGKETIKVDNIKLTEKSGFTIEFWFNPDKESKSTQQLVYVKDRDAEFSWVVKFDAKAGKLYLTQLGAATTQLELAKDLATDKWIYLALSLKTDGTLQTFINGEQVGGNLVFNDVNQYLGKKEALTLVLGGSEQANDLFTGKICQVKVFSEVLTTEEILLDMDKGRSANATFKSTFPIDFKLNTVYDGSENPVLYIDNSGNGQQLKLDIINVSGTGILFENTTFNDQKPLGEENYHLQLRFKKQVLAEDVLARLTKESGKSLPPGWTFAAGSNIALREDWISFKQKSDVAFEGLLTLILENISAEATAGARNTLVEIKYDNLCYKDSTNIISGSLSRHLDIVSHLGRPNIPFAAGVKGPNTLLNDGSKNSFKIYIANPGTEKISFTAKKVSTANYSKFALHFRENGNLLQSLPNVAFGSSLFAPVATQGEANWIQTFECTNEKAQLAEKAQFEIQVTDFSTVAASGTVYLYLEYQNVPGYWDGTIAIPLELSRIIERDSKIGINTIPDPKQADIQVKGKAKFDDVESTKITIQKTVIDASQPNLPFQVNQRIKDQTGFLMPVGSIIAYGGRSAPEGWLTCDNTILSSNSMYDELRAIIGPTTPDLRQRFIVGTDPRNPEYDFKKTGGQAMVALKEQHIPAHTHIAKIAQASVFSTVNSGDLKLMSAKAYNAGVSTENGNRTIYDRGAADAVELKNAVKENHTHDIKVEPTGGSEWHENRPPYYALIYIIKY